MLRALGFRNQTTSISQNEAVPLILKQACDFELALQAMDFLLDDRTQEGLHLINDDPDSTIKTLANGVIKFLESTLGFEPEVMKQAGEILTKAENLSSRDRSKYQKLKLQTSSIFPPGTEYAITYAESTLLNALIMLLSESAIESVKALYKLRKAYQTLEETFKLINEHEASSENKTYKNSTTNDSSTSLSSDVSSNIFADIPFTLTPDQAKDQKITSVAQKVSQMRFNRLNGSHIGNSPASDRLRSTLGLSSDKAAVSLKTEQDQITKTIISENQSTVDEFIISGANLCYGILQLVLSLLPPAVGKVLSIVGFKGSREDGLKKIWKSVESRNVLGCIGVLGLLVFYDGPFQFTDADFDLPELHKFEASVNEENLTLQKTRSKRKMDNESKALQGIGKPTLLHPGKKLEDALLDARALFPNSALWLLQEARMLASRGRLQESLDLMDSIDRKIEMRQVEALLVFDRAMILMFLHQYERAATEILRLLNINAWSPGLYTYGAAACYVELYRMCVSGIAIGEVDLSKIDYYRSRALELFKKAPVLSKTAKKQMPFDKFVLRKMAKIESVAKANNLDLIDAVGTSPIHELIYFWNGYNRMPEAHLETSQKLIDFSISIHAKISETTEESMIRNLLQSITLRRLGNINEGNELLDSKVLSHIINFVPNGTYTFNKLSSDPWLYPTALYEKSLFTWKHDGIDGLEDSKEWLRRATAYSDDFELSTRIGMKIKAALGRLDSL